MAGPAVRGHRLRGVDELRPLPVVPAAARPRPGRPAGGRGRDRGTAGCHGAHRGAAAGAVLGRLGRPLQPQDHHRPECRRRGAAVRAARLRHGRPAAVPAGAARGPGAGQHGRDAGGDHRPCAPGTPGLRHQHRQRIRSAGPGRRSGVRWPGRGPVRPAGAVPPRCRHHGCHRAGAGARLPRGRRTGSGASCRS